jgi:hypothetical protein
MVARWYIFIPVIGVENVGLSVYFMAIWCVFSVLVCFAKKNLATLLKRLLICFQKSGQAVAMQNCQKRTQWSFFAKIVLLQINM